MTTNRNSNTPLKDKIIDLNLRGNLEGWRQALSEAIMETMASKKPLTIPFEEYYNYTDHKPENLPDLALNKNKFFFTHLIKHRCDQLESVAESYKLNHVDLFLENYSPKDPLSPKYENHGEVILYCIKNKNLLLKAEPKFNSKENTMALLHNAFYSNINSELIYKFLSAYQKEVESAYGQLIPNFSIHEKESWSKMQDALYEEENYLFIMNNIDDSLFIKTPIAIKPIEGKMNSILNQIQALESLCENNKLLKISREKTNSSNKTLKL